MTNNQQVYCICRTTDVSTFMIGCDNCEEWYHGHCIGVTELQSKQIKHFFCDLCQKKNPNLKCVYKKQKTIKDESIKETKKHKDKKEIKKEQKKEIKVSTHKTKKSSHHHHHSTSSPANAAKPSFGSEVKREPKVPEVVGTHATSTVDEVRGRKKNAEDFDTDSDSSEDEATKHCIYGLDDCGICAYCKEFGKKAKQSRNCGVCDQCRRIEDCGKCDHCLPGKKSMSASREHTPIRSPTTAPGTGAKVPAAARKPGHGTVNGGGDVSLQRKAQKNARVKKKRPVKAVTKRRSLKVTSAAVVKRPKLTGDRPQKPLPLDQQCYGPGCVIIARKTSRFCSEECGLSLANERLKQILPGRIEDWKSSPCVAKENNAKKLQRIRDDQQVAREQLVDLDLKYDDLLEQINKCVGAEPDDSDVDTAECDSKEDDDCNVYCVICGNEVNQKSAIKHMDRCFAKYESQTSFGSIYKTQIQGNMMFCDYYSAQSQTYCKRLKVLCPEHSKEKVVEPDEVCGCPLVKDLFELTGEFCLTRKRKCMKHPNWEKLRKAQIDMLRLRQWMKLDDLFDKERVITQEDGQRAGVLGLLCNQTVVHSQGIAVVPDIGGNISTSQPTAPCSQLEAAAFSVANSNGESASPSSSLPLEPYDDDVIMADNSY